MNSLYAWTTLIVLAALFPQETSEIVVLAGLSIKTFALNSILFVRAFCIYRKLSKDLKAFGLEPPAFVFVPIQNRKQ